MLKNEGFQHSLKTCEDLAFKTCRSILVVCPGAFITVHGGDIGRGNDVHL